MALLTWAVNHLTAEVTQLSDYLLAREISAVGTTGGCGQGCGAGGWGYQGCGGWGGHCCGTGRGNQGRGGEKRSTNYYSPEEWEKLLYKECDKIHKEHDKKGEQGGTKRNVSDLTTKQLTTKVIIRSIQKSSGGSENDNYKDESTPKTSNAGDAFGGREGAKRSKTREWLLAAVNRVKAAYTTAARRAAKVAIHAVAQQNSRNTFTAQNEFNSHTALQIRLYSVSERWRKTCEIRGM
jgi:hypothetical protein